MAFSFKQSGKMKGAAHCRPDMHAPLRISWRKVKCGGRVSCVYPALIKLAHQASNAWGHQPMKYDHDRFLMVRTELHDLHDALRMTDFDSTPLQFLLRLEQIRATASFHGLTAIAEIASTYEAALQRVQGRGATVVESFSAILDDAIGVAHVHPKASEALLASVAIRLG
jgi:hypothetical protein